MSRTGCGSWTARLSRSATARSVPRAAGSLRTCRSSSPTPASSVRRVSFARTKESGRQLGVTSGASCQQHMVTSQTIEGKQYLSLTWPGLNQGKMPAADAKCARASMPKNQNEGAGGDLGRKTDETLASVSRDTVALSVRVSEAGSTWISYAETARSSRPSTLSSLSMTTESAPQPLRNSPGSGRPSTAGTAQERTKTQFGRFNRNYSAPCLRKRTPPSCLLSVLLVCIDHEILISAYSAARGSSPPGRLRVRSWAAVFCMRQAESSPWAGARHVRSAFAAVRPGW
jgi:hypothetical protein